MWLEDKTSIATKVKIARNMNVAGLAIYRSGYENKEIYSVLKFEEE
jgi:spore germination protein YaaH